MALFDNVGKKLSDVAATTVSKSKEIAGNAKLSVEVSTEEKNIKGYYEKLGKWYYDNFKDDPAEETKEVVEAINASFAKIDELNADAKKDDTAQIG